MKLIALHSQMLAIRKHIFEYFICDIGGQNMSGAFSYELNDGTKYI